MTSYMLVRHKVNDFNRWMADFENHEISRRMSGSEGSHVFRNAEDANEVLFLIKWETLGEARKFMNDTNQVADDAKQTREDASVTSEPRVYFLEEEDELEY